MRSQGSDFRARRGPPSPGSRIPDLNGLFAEPRRMKILAWLQEEGSARVRDLSAAFAVSEATIRQDLEKLETEGHITRQHGGAFLRTVTRQVETLSLQHMENIEKKRKIGVKAASLVGDGETIILDAGSTTTEVAHISFGRSSLTVITNALNIALMLGAAPGYAVHMPGGQFKAPTLSLSGDQAAEYFDEVYAGKLFSPPRRRAGYRTDLSELCRFATQAGDDPRRFSRLSRRRFDQDQSLVVHAAGRARCHSFLHHGRRHPPRGRPRLRKPRHRGHRRDLRLRRADPDRAPHAHSCRNRRPSGQAEPPCRSSVAHSARLRHVGPALPAAERRRQIAG